MVPSAAAVSSAGSLSAGSCATGASRTSFEWRRYRCTTASRTSSILPCALSRPCRKRGELMRPQPVTIVGCGLAGALLATMLARRGFPVTLYERRDDPRRARVEAGRSINLALAARGIRPLEQCGVLAQVQPHLVPMRGRLLHEISGAQVLQPYGQRPNEVIQSVGRAALNQVLAEAAEQAGAQLRFGQRCLGF